MWAWKVKVEVEVETKEPPETVRVKGADILDILELLILLNTLMGGDNGEGV